MTAVSGEGAGLTLYGMGSPNVIKVMILLEELSLPYRFQRVDVIHGEQFEPAFMTLNPNRKVPVLVDAREAGDPVILFESGVILMYLAEKSGRFWPHALAARYELLKWLMLQMASFGPMSGQAIHFNRAVTEPSYARDRFTNELNRLLALLEERLGEYPHVAGLDYSLADMAFLPWCLTIKRMMPELIELPHLQEWMARLGARPAVAAAIESSIDHSRRDFRAVRDADQATLDRYFGRRPATVAAP